MGASFDGEKEVKTAISNLNAQLKTLKSEAEKVRSAFAGQEKSEESLTAASKVLSSTVSVQENKIKTLREAVEKAISHEAAWAERIAKTKAELSEEQAKLDALKRSTTATTEEIKKQAETVEKLQGTVNRYEQAQVKSNTNTEKWKNTLNQAEAALNKTQKELDDTNSELRQFAARADDAADEADDLGDSAKKAGGHLSSIGVAFGCLVGNLAADAIRAAGEAIKDFISDTVNLGMTFDSSMSNVQALSGATAQEMESLTAAAKEAGKTTIYSASEAADALGYMALAGWDTQEMTAGLTPVLNLAASASMDLAEASDIVTDYLTAFGMTADDAGHFTDVMAYAMANSNTDVTALGEAYKNCAATAASMGYTLEDTTAVLMTMANAGVKGGEAGTGLNTIMTRLATDTKDCATELEKYGVAVYDTGGNMNSLSSILTGISGVWTKLTDEEQAHLAKTIAGTNQYSKLQTVMSGLSEEAIASGNSFSDYADALKSCDGAAKDISNTMQDNLAGDLKTLNSVWEDFQLTLYETQSGAMRDMVQTISGDLIPALGDLVSGAENAGKDFLSAISDLGSQAGDMLGDIVGSFLGDDVGDAVSDTISVVADNLGDLFTMAQSLGPAMSDIISIGTSAVETLLPGIVNMIEILSPLVNSIMGAAEKLANAILPILADAIEAVGTVLEPVVEVLSVAFDAIGMVADGLGWLVDGLKWVASGCPAVADNFEEVCDASDKLTDSVGKNVRAWERFIEQKDAALQSDGQEISHIESLKDELDSLVDKNGKVKEGYEARANYIANQLSEATGQEIGFVDGTIEKYGQLSKAIQDTIEQKKIAALQDYYSDIMSEYEGGLSQMKSDLYENKQALDQVKAAMDNTSQGTEEYNRLVEEHNVLAQQNNDIVSEIEIYAAASREGMDLYAAAAAGDMEKVNSLLNNHMEVVERDGERTLLTLEEKLAHEQVYTDKVQTLSQQRLEAGDTEMAESLAMLNEGNAQALSALEEQAAAEREIQANNNQEKTTLLWDWINETVNATGQCGKDSGTECASGLASGTGAMSSAAGSLSSAAQSTLWSSIGSFSWVGQAMADGMASGFSAHSGGVISAAVAGVNAAIAAAKEAAKINSPSKRTMEIGQGLSEGLAVGIEKNVVMATDAIARSMDQVVNTAAMTVQAMEVPSLLPMEQANLVQRDDSVVFAINSLGRTLLEAVRQGGNTYNVNGVTYDDGSNVSGAVESLIHGIRLEGRV